jgi:predicted nucleic acid-binding protein
MKFRNALYDAHYRFSTSLSPERHKADAAAQATDWLELFPCAAASNSAVRTAGEAGCVAVLTEDLADGAELGGIRIHNPFAAGGGLTDPACRLLGL